MTLLTQIADHGPPFLRVEREDADPAGTAKITLHPGPAETVVYLSRQHALELVLGLRRVFDFPMLEHFKPPTERSIDDFLGMLKRATTALAIASEDDALRILIDLALTEEPLEGDSLNCTLCSAQCAAGGTGPEHLPECPWRRARDHVTKAVQRDNLLRAMHVASTMKGADRG